MSCTYALASRAVRSPAPSQQSTPSPNSLQLVNEVSRPRCGTLTLVDTQIRRHRPYNTGSELPVAASRFSACCGLHSSLALTNCHCIRLWIHTRSHGTRCPSQWQISLRQADRLSLFDPCCLPVPCDLLRMCRKQRGRYRDTQHDHTPLHHPLRRTQNSVPATLPPHPTA